MDVLQAPNHFIRWYSMVAGLLVCMATIWLLHEILGSYRPGIIFGGVLFFVVWIVLVVIHAPFAVTFAVDVGRGAVQVGAQEFAINKVISLDTSIEHIGRTGGQVEVVHDLRVDGNANPIVLRPAAAKRQMDRRQVEAYGEFLSHLDFGPENPVVRREQHRNAEDFGAAPGQRDPLADELVRGQAVAQIEGLLADPEFRGGPAPQGFEGEAPGRAADYTRPHYRRELAEFSDDAGAHAAGDAAAQMASAQPQESPAARARRGPSGDENSTRRHERSLDHHRTVVRDLGRQIEQRTARLGRLRRILGWASGIVLTALIVIVLVGMFEALPEAIDDAVTAAVVLTFLLTIIVAVVHSFLFDLHVRAVRREGGRLMAPPSSAAQSVAALAQHWWSLYEEDKKPEWNTTTGSAALDPRDPEWSPEEVVMESGAVPDVLARAWFENPRRSVLVLTFVLGAAAAALMGIGLETGDWPWYVGAGALAVVAIGVWARADRNTAHKREDLREFAHRLESLRRSGGTQIR